MWNATLSRLIVSIAISMMIFAGLAPSTSVPPAAPESPAWKQQRMRYLSPNCKTGIASSCIELGMLILESSNAPGRLPMAKSAFERACERGVKSDCIYIELLRKDPTGGLLKPVLEDVPCNFQIAQVRGCKLEDCQQCPMSSILAQSATLFETPSEKSKKLAELPKGTNVKSIESIDMVEKFGTALLYKDELIGEKIYKSGSKIKLSNNPIVRGSSEEGFDPATGGYLIEEGVYYACVKDNAQFVYGTIYESEKIKEKSTLSRWYKISLQDNRSGFLKMKPHLFGNKDLGCGN